MPSIIASTLLGVVSALLALTVPELCLLPFFSATLLVIYKFGAKMTVAPPGAATPAQSITTERSENESQDRHLEEEPVTLADGGRIVQKLSGTILTRVGFEPDKKDIDNLSFRPEDDVDQISQKTPEQEDRQEIQAPRSTTSIL